MKFYRKDVRARVPQRMNYTFYDETNAIIDLTNYSVVKIILRLDGHDDTIMAGQFNGAKTTGRVYADVPFYPHGIWQAQFLATSVNADPLYGEPIQVKVRANEDDLSAADPILSY